MPTETRWTTAVAIVMPSRTGHTLKRVAKVIAMSWDLSPSSATKMTPKATRVLTRTASTGPAGGPLSRCGGDGRPGGGGAFLLRGGRKRALAPPLLRGQDFPPACRKQAARPDVRRE